MYVFIYFWGDGIANVARFIINYIRNNIRRVQLKHSVYARWLAICIGNNHVLLLLTFSYDIALSTALILYHIIGTISSVFNITDLKTMLTSIAWNGPVYAGIPYRNLFCSRISYQHLSINATSWNTRRCSGFKIKWKNSSD
jgi:hypothetical protein